MHFLHFIKGSWIQGTGTILKVKEEIKDQTDPSNKIRYCYCSTERNHRYALVRSHSKQLHISGNALPVCDYRMLYSLGGSRAWNRPAWAVQCAGCLCAVLPRCVETPCAPSRGSRSWAWPRAGTACTGRAPAAAACCAAPPTFNALESSPLFSDLDHFRTLKYKKNEKRSKNFQTRASTVGVTQVWRRGLYMTGTVFSRYRTVTNKVGTTYQFFLHTAWK